MATKQPLGKVAAMDAYVALLSTAAGIGFFHTLFGPDHYVPFVAMSRAGQWSVRKTFVVTMLCGIGHVASSVALGLVGVAGGILLFRLENLESVRGELAGWMLLGFGILYLIWGLMQAFRNAPHVHYHAHSDGTVHEHVHRHQGDHLHAHELAGNPPSDGDNVGLPQAKPRPAARLSPWVLFTVFLFGPCEPLIPMLMYPAAESDYTLVFAVSLVFGATTIMTMTAAVALLLWGATWFQGHAWHRYGHAVAGAAITACGVAIKVGL